MEGDLNFPETFLDFFHFNPLPPYGGRHRWNIRNSTRESISIHSLRMEGDPRFSDPAKFHVLFQSTPSVWRETKELSGVQIFFCYFNPLPPYGGRPIPATARQNNQSFQSTPSVWRETQTVLVHLDLHGDFNPLPPYGGRQVFLVYGSPLSGFQSTPSVWRETFQMVGVLRNGKFQSTPSVWRETYNDSEEPLSGAFQSTPSVWRETCHRCFKFCNLCNFNPLPPYGGRRSMPGVWVVCHYFNPLPPYGGRRGSPTAQHIR